MTWYSRSAWEEAHTRRSNEDLIAAVLSQSAAAGDLIVVQTAFEAITFNQYYHGPTPWVSVPPINSHLVCRNDLWAEQRNAQLNQQDPMTQVLLAITNTLRGSHQVWVVGNMFPVCPKPAPTIWFGTYQTYWSGQVTECLTTHALQFQTLAISGNAPVFDLENLPLFRFSGYKSATAEPAVGK
jgi:hypothetical protein